MEQTMRRTSIYSKSWNKKAEPCFVWPQLEPNMTGNSNLSPFYTCELAKSLQSCLTLCDPVDCSPPDSSVHGILQARILEWVPMPSSRGSSWPRDRTCISLPTPVLAGSFFTSSATWEVCHLILHTFTNDYESIMSIDFCVWVPFSK